MSIGNLVLQFTGFMLQVLPIALLCVVPFSDDALCLPRQKILSLFTGGTVVFSIGFTILSRAIFLPDASHDTLLRTAANLYMTICIVLWASAFFKLIRFPAVGKILVLILLIYYAAVLFILNDYIIGIFIGRIGMPEGSAIVIYSPETVLVSFALLAMTMPLIYLFLRREILYDLSHMESRILKRSCMGITVSCLLFFVCVFTLSTFQFYYGFSDLVILFFLISFILTDCILFYMLFSEVRLHTEKDQLEDQLRNFDNKYHQIIDNIERARRDRHDIRHHLNIISALNHEGAKERLDEYLKLYDASFMELEQLPLCGYPAFDNIIRYYIESADKQGIRVETEMHAIRERLTFDVIDLTVLLGNLMENAIESCCMLSPDSPRFISIHAKQAGASFLLKIENSCTVSHNNQPEFTDGKKFISTKHTIGHGQGLKSIQFIAEKYGGSAEFKKSDSVFTARIVMNVP